MLIGNISWCILSRLFIKKEETFKKLWKDIPSIQYLYDCMTVY